MSSPFLFIDGNKIYLIVAQRCIEVPSPVDLSMQYNRCNGFLIYRGLLQNVSQGRIVDISRFASKSWKIAGRDFRHFFSSYARNINNITTKKSAFRQFKHYMPSAEHKTKRNYKHNDNQNMVFNIEREVIMNEVHDVIEREVIMNEVHDAVEREVIMNEVHDAIEREVIMNEVHDAIEREVIMNEVHDAIEREVIMREEYGKEVAEFKFIL